MKGVIINYSENENIGQILGEDGHRYNFNSYNFMNLERKIYINDEVDFVIKNNKAKEIFPINVRNINQKNINFKEIENKLNDKNIINKIKKEYFFYLKLIFIIFLIALYFVYTSKTNSAIFILSLIALLSSGAYSLGLIILVLKPNSLVKKAVLNEYLNDQIKRFNAVPENLQYKEVKYIHIEANNYQEAEELLLNEIFDLQADAIINYSYQHSSTSHKSGNIITGKTREISRYHTIDGTLIRYI